LGKITPITGLDDWGILQWDRGKGERVGVADFPRGEIHLGLHWG